MDSLSPRQLLMLVILAPLAAAGLWAWTADRRREIASHREEDSRPYGWEERRR